MTTFESEIKTIAFPIEQVYNTLSDLNNLARLKDKIPQDKLKDLEYDTDFCRFTIDPVGKVAFRIIEREPVKTIKFGAEQSPIACNMWIQLLPADNNETKMKLTIKAELNPFIKGMVSKPLQDGLDKIASILATITY